MSGLVIRLFGRLSIERGDAFFGGVSGAKVQELFCYLLLHRNRAHAREALASRLWGDAPTAQSKKYLRQALWQLQSGLRVGGDGAGSVLEADAHVVRLETGSGIWVDVEVFERAALLARTVPCERLDGQTAATVQAAVDLYRGDLLEGWYQEWCLYERERLQDAYLMMLDKLGAYCEAHGLYDDGVRYAAASLRYDRARECAHQRLMRLYSLGGDRAAALRQYDRCIIALDEELGVKPSAETASLYERIGAGDVVAPKQAAAPTDAARAPALTDVLGRLRHLETALASVQEQVRADIEVVQQTLARTTSAAGPKTASRPAARRAGGPRLLKPAAGD